MLPADSCRRGARIATAICFALVLGIALPATAGVSNQCVVMDNGTGTVDLPPQGCGYVSPNDLHAMINGLPPGTQINIDANHSDFFNVTRGPGGSLGGEVEQFQSVLIMKMKGTGMLAGFNRNIGLPLQCETHVGPRTPGDPVQSFATDMASAQGAIGGDPDFDLLRITAGTVFGMPSPGHTTLTRLPNGSYNVDSFFDITYRIDFIGRMGGALSGMSGSTTGTIRMGAGRPAPAPCTPADDGSGTVPLPPAGCDYVSPEELHMMINGLPAGTTIAVDARHGFFFNQTTMPGGSLGGQVEQFGSVLNLQLHGTGGLSNFQRDMSMQIQCETHTGPRQLGTPVQSFDTDMFRLQGQLPAGDPDFDLLRVTGGTGLGMPSPGHTTLTRSAGKVQGPGNWNVDSFFDVFYRIDFVGRPGGRLGGMSGSTTATIRMQAGQSVGATDSPPPPPTRTVLHQNVPNPFNPSTRIMFELGTTGAVNLRIVDVSGREVRSIVNSLMEPGRYTFQWDGMDNAGVRAASGTYFYTLTAPDFNETKSLVLLK